MEGNVLSKKQEKVCVKLWLTQREKEMVKQSAKLCGLTQTEYLRQSCLGRHPRPQPASEFWELLDEIYSIHGTLERLAVSSPELAEHSRNIEALVLRLQEAA